MTFLIWFGLFSALRLHSVTSAPPAPVILEGVKLPGYNTTTTK